MVHALVGVVLGPVLDALQLRDVDGVVIIFARADVVDRRRAAATATGLAQGDVGVVGVAFVGRVVLDRTFRAGLQLRHVDRVGIGRAGGDVGDLPLVPGRAHRYRVGAVGHRTGSDGHAVL